jgi:hypothetical protein
MYTFTGLSGIGFAHARFLIALFFAMTSIGGMHELSRLAANKQRMQYLYIILISYKIASVMDSASQY